MGFLRQYPELSQFNQKLFVINLMSIFYLNLTGEKKKKTQKIMFSYQQNLCHSQTIREELSRLKPMS